MSSIPSIMHSACMYALIGVMHMVDGMILNKVDFESFSKKHREVILNSSI